MSGWFTFALTMLAALGSGLIGGVFFAFSTFVMRALARLRPAQGIAAMQSINVTVLTPWFLGPLFGTAAASLALAVTSVANWREPGSILRLAGGGLYLLGTVLVTMVCNMPRNNALNAIEPDSPDGETFWTRFVPSWTVWNSVRTAAAIAAAAAFTFALVVDRSGR